MNLSAPTAILATLALASCAQWPAQQPQRPLVASSPAPQPYSTAPAQSPPAYPSAGGWRQQPNAQAPSSVAGQELGSGARLYDLHSAGVQMRVVVFDTRQCVLKVVDQPSPTAGPGVIGQAMPYFRAVAGVNGGFFHPDFTPLGLLIAGGRKYGQFTDNSLVTGSVLMVSGEPYLVWNHEFLGESGVTDLVQSGPRLVDSGRPVGKLDASKVAARTFIANDGKRLWVIGTTSNTSLAQLAQALATPGAIPGLRIDRALNLDGGRSSAFWAQTAGGQTISQPGWSTVRDYLAVVPR